MASRAPLPTRLSDRPSAWRRCVLSALSLPPRTADPPCADCCQLRAAAPARGGAEPSTSPERATRAASITSAVRPGSTGGEPIAGGAGPWVVCSAAELTPGASRLAHRAAAAAAATAGWTAALGQLARAVRAAITSAAERGRDGATCGAAAGALAPRSRDTAVQIRPMPLESTNGTAAAREAKISSIDRGVSAPVGEGGGDGGGVCSGDV